MKTLRVLVKLLQFPGGLQLFSFDICLTLSVLWNIKDFVFVTLKKIQDFLENRHAVRNLLNSADFEVMKPKLFSKWSTMPVYRFIRGCS